MSASIRAGLDAPENPILSGAADFGRWKEKPRIAEGRREGTAGRNKSKPY
jgi:hypothetical protein